jgi:hypothetical protein
MTYRLLSGLSTKQQTWCIKVKVMRLCESINNRTDELMSLDMVLMDEKVNLFLISLYISYFLQLFGLMFFILQKNVIHCVIWKSMIETYKTTIKENGVYMIKKFKVEATTYRPVNNDLKTVFMFTTSVK